MIETAALLDLADLPFWYLVSLAVAILLPLQHAGARRLTLAVFYLVSIAVLLGFRTAIVAAALAGFTFITSRAIAHPRTQSIAGARTTLLASAMIVALILFTTHKLPSPATSLHWFSASLAAIGFSYIFLRMIDLLRVVADGRAPAPGLVDTIGYLLPLHMLAAGPIESFSAYAQRPAVPPRPSSAQWLNAIERIVGGLFKSYVLAGGLRTTLLTDFAADGLYLLLEIHLFYLWVYLDFSAYSDIAVGLGRFLGAEAPENFDRPLTARNLTIFWERWHISLSQFIRRNVFIPTQLTLGRRFSRHPLWVTSIAFFVAFTLCGLWHALEPAFLIWGVYHGLGLVACNLYRYALKRRLGRPGMERYLANRVIRWLATAVTFEFVAFSLAFALSPAFAARLFGALQ